MSLKDVAITRFHKLLNAIEYCIKMERDINAKIDGEIFYMPYRGREDMLDGAADIGAFIQIAQPAQRILFSADQAMVFSDISYQDPLEFRLPFPKVFLEFTEPLKIPYTKRSENDYDRGSLLAAAIHQFSVTKREFEAQVEKDSKKTDYKGPIPYPDQDEFFINRIVFLYEDFGCEFITWASGTNIKLTIGPGVRQEAMLHWQNVVVACIGYINCENIYLERKGDIPENVNRNRERKGKLRLEPYYICRVKGIQHEPHTTQSGSKHGIRYDVRGHFRRLTTGKTIWVKPHQRGLENELYIPKVYQVDKNSKPYN